ncbi:MAG: hypothetical protein V7L14_27000 [Nostoc sp.]|uniref:hypothetical protein n=1 Tax=unclassified Nostoc TaxID=2593658 RepID=UPI00083DE3C2|nr:hypothetical protein [Nostoc sp. KVJ20]ODG98575.1 hypothetical protein A4S05_08485 [Nostoc sp. KVJ20]
MSGILKFDDLYGKTIEEGEELIKGFSYELRVKNGKSPTKPTQGANQTIVVVLEDGKIVSFKVI